MVNSDHRRLEVFPYKDMDMNHHSCQTLAGGMEMETVRLSGKETFVLPEVIRDLHKWGLL